MIEKKDEWLGPRGLLLRPGSKFKVMGLRAVFEFVALERNTETGAEWIVGVAAGHMLTRCFHTDKVVGPKAVTQPRGPRKDKSNVR